jgi:hypothetical protein
MAQHRQDARPYPDQDGPPTDELPRPIPAAAPAPSPGTDLVARVRRSGGSIVERLGRPRVIVIVAVVVLALAATAVVLTYRVATNTGTSGGDTGIARHLTYKATSTEKTVIVTYTQGDNDLDGQTQSASPWSMAATVTASVAVLTVTSGSDARNPDRAASVTCAIEDTTTGQTLASKSAPPSAGATVTCVAGNLGT